MLLLLQLCVLSFGWLVDRDVWISVFPQRQEILIDGFGFRLVSLHGVSAGGVAGDSVHREVSLDYAMIKIF